MGEYYLSRSDSASSLVLCHLNFDLMSLLCESNSLRCLLLKLLKYGTETSDFRINLTEENDESTFPVLKFHFILGVVCLI